ncbi:hypothetical protein ACHHV8_10110 [Paenibacillus sp. TAB 01]|uniref:hypothetical protein n=1 Tax=Paenibacillus sp. TAB 01 TaxID=3368988 RepID=UPI00375013DB
MIAVLYKDGVLASFIDKVTSIDGDTIEAESGGAKGVQHDILVLDQASIRYEQVESGRISYTDWVPDEQGIPQPEEKVNVYYTDIPILVTTQGEYRSGDDFDASLFTDERDLIPKTQAQIDRERLSDLELMIADIITGGL